MGSYGVVPDSGMLTSSLYFKIRGWGLSRQDGDSHQSQRMAGSTLRIEGLCIFYSWMELSFVIFFQL